MNQRQKQRKTKQVKYHNSRPKQKDQKKESVSKGVQWMKDKISETDTPVVPSDYELGKEFYRAKKMKEKGQTLYIDSLPGQRPLSKGKRKKIFRAHVKSALKINRQLDIIENDMADFGYTIIEENG